MILTKINESSQIEVISKEELLIHFGRVSISISDKEFIIFASMFDPSWGDTMPDEKTCSVSKVKEGVYLVSFKGITMQMCGHSLANFSKLLIRGVEEYCALFAVLDKSKEDIETLLFSIEKKFNYK